MPADKSALEELASRIEAASAEEQYAMLSEAHYLINGGADLGMSLTSYRHWLPNHKFGKMLTAEAWLDAAMTLVPEGLNVRMGTNGNAPWAQCRKNALSDCFNGGARTLALSLCAAALRALAKEKGE